MANEFKGRYAYYCEGSKSGNITTTRRRISLNQIRVVGGTYLARKILTKKQYTLSDGRWYELELLPGELSADATKKKEICSALYKDLRQSYPSLTLAYVTEEVDKLMSGAKPDGIIQMFAHKYLVELGLIKREQKEGDNE